MTHRLHAILRHRVGHRVGAIFPPGSGEESFELATACPGLKGGAIAIVNVAAATMAGYDTGLADAVGNRPAVDDPCTQHFDVGEGIVLGASTDDRIAAFKTAYADGFANGKALTAPPPPPPPPPPAPSPTVALPTSVGPVDLWGTRTTTTTTPPSSTPATTSAASAAPISTFDSLTVAAIAAAGLVVGAFFLSGDK